MPSPRDSSENSGDKSRDRPATESLSPGSKGTSTCSRSESGSFISYEDSSSSDEGSPRKLGFGSGRSSAPTSGSRLSSRKSSSGSDRMSSTRSSDDAGYNTRRARIKNLFKKQQVDEMVEPEPLGELKERVDAKLLEEVQEYDAVPSEAASYGKNTFWDERYAGDKEMVEWYHPWANLAPTLIQYMDEQDQVLVCGCGTSEMSVDMYDDGFVNIVNADRSRVAIDLMTDTYKAYPMEWKSVDLTLEEFPEEKFDVALDKACLDSIACSHHGVSKVEDYLQQMDRVLHPEGAFICVSFAPPEERLELLEYWDIDRPAKCLAWDVHVDAIAKPERKHPRGAEKDSDVYYIYVCIKDPNKVIPRTFHSYSSKWMNLDCV